MSGDYDKPGRDKRGFWPTVNKGLPLLDLSEREHRVLTFVMNHGRSGRWVVYGGIDLADSLAYETGLTRRTTIRALTDLKDRGWIITGRDARNRAGAQLVTAPLKQACDDAWWALRVKRAVGVHLYDRLGGAALDLVTLEKLAWEEMHLSEASLDFRMAVQRVASKPPYDPE